MARTDLGARLLSAGLLGPLLLLLLFRGSPEAWYFLVLAATALATLELSAMTHPGDRVAQAACTVTSMAVSWVVYHHSQEPRALLSVLLVLPIVGLMLALWRLTDLPSAALRAMSGIASPLYIGGLLASLALLRRDAGELGPYYVLLALMISWLGDTGGFLPAATSARMAKSFTRASAPRKPGSASGARWSAPRSAC